MLRPPTLSTNRSNAHRFSWHFRPYDNAPNPFEKREIIPTVDRSTRVVSISGVMCVCVCSRSETAQQNKAEGKGENGSTAPDKVFADWHYLPFPGFSFCVGGAEARNPFAYAIARYGWLRPFWVVAAVGRSEGFCFVMVRVVLRRHRFHFLQ